MIEKWLKHDLSIKRYRKFKKRKATIIALVLLVLLSAFSLSAEFWSNSKPLIMKYQGDLYFPVVKNYHPTVFGVHERLVMDYRELKFENGDWVIYPVIPWTPYESNKSVKEYPSPPSSDNWLGTDSSGRDVLSRLLYGFRYSMTYAILVWALSFLVGIILGGIMGYAGGRTDFVGQRIVEILSTVPQFFLLIIIISIFQPNLFLLVLISCLFSWIFISYYVRAEFLKLRKREFVDAARALGASHRRLIFVHVLPNALGPVLTFSPFVIASNITALASLDFLGFGLPPPTPSWGELLSEAQKYFTMSWWLALFPSLALFGTLVLLTLVGEGVRDAFDPNRK